MRRVSPTPPEPLLRERLGLDFYRLRLGVMGEVPAGSPLRDLSTDEIRQLITELRCPCNLGDDCFHTSRNAPAPIERLLAERQAADGSPSPDG